MHDTLDFPTSPMVGLGVEAMFMETPQEWLLDSKRLKLKAAIHRVYRWELHRNAYKKRWNSPFLKVLMAVLNSRFFRFEDKDHEHCWIEANDDGTRTLVTTRYKVVEGEWRLVEERLPVLVACTPRYRPVRVI